MTKEQPDQELPPGADVVGTTEKSVVRERLVQRDCAWCGQPVKYAGTGRRPKFCSDAHRTRHWELRTVLDRLEADVAAGLVRTEAVREVVERVVTVERTVTLQPRVEPARPARPASAKEWTGLVQPLLVDVLRRPSVWSADPDVALLAGTLADVVRALFPMPEPVSAVPTATTGQGPSRAERRRQERADRKRRH
ncbi:hypothetical protein [Kitasatospora purpeofusca]|uniref:hypothetical protein n=1 Tax=Kitasatospora purpeofusca TaxID=67352 RepID=UPI00382D574B